MGILDGLNKSQLEAVKTTEGPVMVMAGAGAGKTKVLTSRISYIISELGVMPSSILAVTFTNKAANEMKERVAKMLDIDTKYMWISTFHSFCARLLRLEIDALPPFNKKFIILDEEDSLKVCKTVMNDLGYDSKEYKPTRIRGLISKSKNFTNFHLKDLELNNIYKRVKEAYQKYLEDNNMLDFDDLIIRTIELFKKNVDILKKYQNKFNYILVDEFQDTNELQYNLMFMLSQRFHNIFVVGDDFQSIYSFRGAKIENIKRFRDDFLETKLILLEQNYRSTNQILNLANKVIENNPNQIKKKLFTNNLDGDAPFYYEAQSSYDESMFVIDKIKEIVGSGDKFSDIAILYRANYISRNFEDMLVKFRIPYKIYGGLSFFSRKEIKDMIAYMRIMLNHDDNFSFDRIINEPKRKIGPTSLEKLKNIANEKNLSLFDSIDYINFNGQAKDNLIEFKKMILKMYSKLESIKLVDLINVLLKDTGYQDYLKSTLDDDTYEDKLGNIKELKSVLVETDESFEGSNEDKLNALLENLALRTDNDNVDNDNSVRLSTYHQVKGLEFKNVFMVAMEEGIFPSQNIVTEEELEEERRICYVGITRAKRNLYVTSAKSRFMYGQQNYSAPSRFIREMEFSKPKRKDVPTFTTSYKVEKKPEEKIIDNEFKLGDKLNHKVFGDGLIVAMDGDIISVAFAMPYGIKKLMKNHPSIRKI